MLNAFRVVYDPSFQNYPHFREPIDTSGRLIDAWNFIGMGRWSGKAKLTISARNDGTIYDVNMGAFDLPIVTQEIKMLLEEHSRASQSVQFVPVQYRATELYILNVIPVVKALDESRSVFTKWTSGDGRSDRLGEYREVTCLKILPRIAAESCIFRIAGWEAALIISSDLKRRFENFGVKGIKYSNVTE